MKRKIFILIFAFLGVLTMNSLQAQQEHLDSVIRAGYTKSVFEYNNRGHNISWAEYRWTSGNWRINIKREYDYNAAGNIIKEARYAWIDDYLQGTTKYEYEYNADGKAILELVYYGISGTTNFLLAAKGEYEYDVDGNLTRIIYFSWINEEWEIFSKVVFELIGELTSRILYYYIDENWVEMSKEEYVLDANENTILYARYFFQDGSWQGNDKFESEYDANGNRTLYVSYYWEEGNWLLSSKTKYEYEYDANKNPVLRINYHWYDEIGWEMYGKNEYEYDLSISNLLLPRDLISTDDNINFTNKRLKTKFYDPNGSFIGEIPYFWSSHIVNIPEIKESKELFVIYPNPIKDKFIIDYNGIVSIKLYNMLGREVLSQNICDRTEINIDHLPKGIYCIKVISDGKVIGNSKIVKF